MKFKPGDLVKVITDSVDRPLQRRGVSFGSIGTVVGYLEMQTPRLVPCVHVSFPGIPNAWADEDALRKISDGEDRRTKSWDDCVWQPNQVAA